MASNYKRLGDYIQQVDVRNTDLSVELLLGVSIEKKFIDSHANTIGTDFKNYKIVKKGQFAYGPVTSRNGDKISIALLDEVDACLISSSYTPFEITKPDELNAEYLMMLFRNSEFDRFARYNSWGSAREVFSWEDFCNSKMYIPDIEEQQKIVRQYKTITDRIGVLEKINENLEQQAQAIFKSWFIDLSPFKGMTPSDWQESTLGNVCTCELGGTPSRAKTEYWNGDIPWINSGEVNSFRIVKPSEFVTELGLSKSATKLLPVKTTVIAITGATLGQVSLLEIASCANQSVVGVIPNECMPYEYIYPYIKANIQELLAYQTGGAQQHINKQNVENLPIIVPSATVLREYREIVGSMYESITNNCFETNILSDLRDLLLTKLMSGELDVSQIDI